MQSVLPSMALELLDLKAKWQPLALAAAAVAADTARLALKAARLAPPLTRLALEAERLAPSMTVPRKPALHHKRPLSQGCKANVHRRRLALGPLALALGQRRQRQRVSLEPQCWAPKPLVLALRPLALALVESSPTRRPCWIRPRRRHDGVRQQHCCNDCWQP